jgi:hypothetical protein
MLLWQKRLLVRADGHLGSRRWERQIESKWTRRAAVLSRAIAAPAPQGSSGGVSSVH